MDHERLGELLLPYVEGDLDAPGRIEIEEHLATCPECRREEQGLRALLAAPDEPLSDFERMRLRRGVRDATGATDTPPARGPRLAWLPPALGVAALLLVVVVGMQLFQGGLGDSDESAMEGGATGEESSADSGGPRPVTLSLSKDGLKLRVDDADAADAAMGDPTEGEEAVVEPDGAAVEEGAMPGEPEISKPSDATSTSGAARAPPRARIESRLEAFARSSKVFRTFAGAYSAQDAPRLRDEFTAELVDGAPDAYREQLVRCTDLVVEARDLPTLPVAAAYGIFQTEEAIMVGFIWSPEEDGPLDQFLLYVWPRGSCQTPLHSQIGSVNAGKS